MPLSDIFTTPFLICLGVSLLLIGFLGMYFTQKIMEQNHKITSMFELVSTMAEEMNAIRNTIMLPNRPIQAQFSSGGIEESKDRNIILNKNSLIPVSEDDDDDEDEDDEDDEDEDEDEDEEDENEYTDEKQESQIKSISLETPIFNISDVVETLEDSNSDSDDDDNDNDEEENESSTDDEVELEELNFEKVANEEIEPDAYLKKITLEESKQEHDIDYKKLSIPKLRSIVAEKGLSTDSSKMKKNELLKLLL